MSFRHERRMSNFAEATDRLALNQPRRVADLLCQRYRALDMSIADAGWERAKHLELVRELVTSSDRKKNVVLPRSSETKRAPSPTRTLRRVSGNTEEHLLRKKARIFLVRESKQSAEKTSRISAEGEEVRRRPGERVRCCSLGVSLVAAPRSSKGAPRWRQRRHVRHTVDGDLLENITRLSRKIEVALTESQLNLRVGSGVLGERFRSTSFIDSHSNALPQPRKADSLSRTLRLLKRRAAHWTLRRLRALNFFLYDTLN